MAWIIRSLEIRLRLSQCIQQKHTLGNYSNPQYQAEGLVYVKNISKKKKKKKK